MDFEPLPPDPYAALGVDKGADAAAIKTAYRKLALKYHPDKCTDDAQRETNTALFHKIQKAYDLVGTDDERKRYEALVRLHDLRNEKIKLQAGRQQKFPIRSYSHYPTATSASASSKGYNFEERRPKGGDTDDLPRSSAKARAESYIRRTAAQPVRVERETRSRSYDYPEDRGVRRREYDDAFDRLRRKDTYATATERKYADIEEELHRHTSRYDDDRPSMKSRRSTARDVPAFETRRSRASPREYRDYEDRRDYIQDELSARERDIATRVAEAYLARKKARKERETRERERSRERDRERRRERAERDSHRRRGSREDDSFDRRPTTLQQSYSSPPYVPGEGPEPRRAQTYSSASNTEAVPQFERSSTMPAVPTVANTSAKREKQYSESKLKNSTALGDSGYSSSSLPDDKYASKKTRSTKYSYPVHADYPYQFETRSPGVASTQERPSTARRPSYPVESVSSSRVLPDRTRRGRERDRDSEYRSSPSKEKLWGEMAPGYPPGHPPRSYPEENIAYSKKYTFDDVQYSPSPRFHRTSTMPVGAS